MKVKGEFLLNNKYFAQQLGSNGIQDMWGQYWSMLENRPIWSCELETGAVWARQLVNVDTITAIMAVASSSQLIISWETEAGGGSQLIVQHWSCQI